MAKTWNAADSSVSLTHGHREEDWIDYKEPSGTVMLRGERSATQPLELLVWIDNKVYVQPDHANPLPERRVLEIQQRIDQALTALGVRHAFVRAGWTSFSISDN